VFKFALVVALLGAAMSLLTGCSGVTISNPDFYTAISAPVTSLRVTQQTQLVRGSQATGAPLT
jgi:hypothetical protein